MSLEAWAALAQVGTFVVIAATAAASLVQLRHLRAANQVAALRLLMDQYEGAELRDAFHFVRVELAGRLEDPAFRVELLSYQTDRLRHPEITICNFFDTWGLNYREGAIEKRAFMRIMAGVTVWFWKELEPVIAMSVNSNGVNTSFQNFEYLAVEAGEWLAVHPDGDYPRGKPRMPLVNPWRETDRAATPIEPGRPSTD
jgi:hypothetical protein